MSAIQVITDYTRPVPTSHAISTFTSTPRWPSATRTFQFSTTYLTPVALTALIPIIIGISVTILLLLHLTIRHTCRHRSTEARIKRYMSSLLATRIQIFLSASIIFIIFTFISLGLIGNFNLNFAAQDGLDLIDGLATDLTRIGFAIVDTSLLVRNRLQAFDARTVQPGGPVLNVVGDMVTPAINAMRDYALVNFPDPGPLRSSLASLVDSFAEVIRIVRRVVRLVYFSLLVIIILITTGPFILFTSSGTSNSRRGRACRVFAQILYLLIPALFAWVVAGVLSAAGATVADLCNTVHEYRDHLLGTNVESTDNVLIKSGFDCPEANATELKAQIDNTANSILESTFLRQSTRLILNMSADGLAESAQWSGGEVLQKFNCSATVEFVGRIETVACGSEGWSAIDGIFDLWLSFIVMAVLLNIALFINLFGVQVSRSLFIFGRGDDVVSSKF